MDSRETIEIYPDKKMGVGSLHTPREYDGRLPPDAGYYLDLVLPRFEEPPKKIGSQVRLLHGRILQIKRSTYMQSNPRILVNVLVILVKILVNLLVKPTKLGQGGHGGANPLQSLSQACIPPPKEGVPTGLGTEYSYVQIRGSGAATPG